MQPRFATANDIPDIAALHVQVWDETYSDLLPQSEIAKRDLGYRLDLWGRVISSGTKVSIIPGVGFAQIAPQRDASLQDQYPLELYSFYTLRHVHGSGAGQALLRHAYAADPQPFTALVLKGNARATRFYEKIGGRFIKEVPETLGQHPIIDVTYGWRELVLPD